MIGLDQMGTNGMLRLLRAGHMCQAYDACDRNTLATYPIANITFEPIGDVPWCNRPALLPSEPTGSATTASKLTAGGK